MRLSDSIRAHGREKYVLPAREKRVRRFSIRAGDVVSELGIGGGRAPAVCSALKTHQFLRENDLRLIEATGPKSGQSTTVDRTPTSSPISRVGTAPSTNSGDPWSKLRGALKDVFAEMGGGEAYLRARAQSFLRPWWAVSESRLTGTRCCSLIGLKIIHSIRVASPRFNRG